MYLHLQGLAGHYETQTVSYGYGDNYTTQSVQVWVTDAADAAAQIQQQQANAAAIAQATADAAARQLAQQQAAQLAAAQLAAAQLAAAQAAQTAATQAALQARTVQEQQAAAAARAAADAAVTRATQQVQAAGVPASMVENDVASAMQSTLFPTSSGNGSAGYDVHFDQPSAGIDGKTAAVVGAGVLAAFFLLRRKRAA